MPVKSARVDEYIHKSAAFAQPILTRIREIVHEAAPEIEEDIKWGMPAFMYKGIVSNLAAFKNHVSLGFWKGTLMKDPQGIFQDRERTQITAIRLALPEDIPAKHILAAYIREAVDLNERGVKLPRTGAKTRRKKLIVPDDLAAALNTNAKAATAFGDFSYTNRKEYLEWRTGAKREDTRARRLATAIEWMTEGKPRNWKYMSRKQGP
jgi:uncharacterized protein YdeI (YjbR/CyaY-like superfamily)